MHMHNRARNKTACSSMTMKNYPATLKLKKELNKIFSYFEREKATYVTREKKREKWRTDANTYTQMATKWKIERGESDFQCSHTHTPVGQEKMKVVQYAQSDTTTLFGSHGTQEGIKHEGKRWSTQEECRFLSKKTWMPQSTRTHWEEEDTSRAKKELEGQ